LVLVGSYKRERANNAANGEMTKDFQRGEEPDTDSDGRVVDLRGTERRSNVRTGCQQFRIQRQG
jgi:hypothetical protein